MYYYELLFSKSDINPKYCEAVIMSYNILIFMIQIQPNALHCIFSFCLVLKGSVDIISIEPPFINPIIQFTTVPVKAWTDKVLNIHILKTDYFIVLSLQSDMRISASELTLYKLFIFHIFWVLNSDQFLRYRCEYPSF